MCLHSITYKTTDRKETILSVSMFMCLRQGPLKPITQLSQGKKQPTLLETVACCRLLQLSFC